MKVPAHKGEQKTAQAYVRDSIRDAIFSGELAAGDRLVQLVLAKQLGVSTTPVREALRELASEGLVRVDPHHGAEVRGINAVELREVYEMRVLLEPDVLRRALPRMSPSAIELAAQLQQQLAGEVTIAERAMLNRRFHRVFLDACDSRLLAEVVAKLQDKTAAYTVAMEQRDRGRPTRANEEHAAILAATRAGDVEAAIAAMLRHIRAPLVIETQIDSGWAAGQGTGALAQAHQM